MYNFGIRGGHTEASGGAVDKINELKEDRVIYPLVIEKLKQAGNTVLDLTPDESMAYPSELTYGINKANNNNVLFGASIHFNSGGGHGCEVWVHENAKAHTLEVANRICNNLSSLGFTNRGIKRSPSDRYLGEIMKTNNSFIIIEICFTDSEIDKNIWDGLSYDSIAFAIANGLDYRVTQQAQEQGNGYVVTNYLPNGYHGDEGFVGVDLEHFINLCDGIRCYARTNSTGKIWFETQVVTLQQCEKIKNNLEQYGLFYSIVNC